MADDETVPVMPYGDRVRNGGGGARPDIDGGAPTDRSHKPAAASPGRHDPPTDSTAVTATEQPPEVASGSGPYSRERLVISLAQGPTLADVTADAPMGPREVMRLGADVAALLAHLHERGDAHGAVTPASIVLGPGGRGRLTHVQGAGCGAVTETGSGLSPPADDVHDLGAALVRALAGPGGNGLPDDTPRSLRRVLAPATEADPTRRPSARQVAEMLAWAARDEPPAAAGPWWPTGGTATRVLAGAATLVALLGLAEVAVLREAPAALAAAPAELPDIPLSPALPTPLPDPPEVSAEARELWDRFVDWLRELVRT